MNISAFWLGFNMAHEGSD